MTKQKTIHCDRAVFRALQKGGTPHLLFQQPNQFKVGQRVKVCERNEEGAGTGPALIGRITFVTSAGTALLPANVGIISIALVKPLDAHDGSNTTGTDEQQSDCLRIDLSEQESQAFMDLLFLPELMQDEPPEKTKKKTTRH